ncbi:MAG: HTH-type transcriptional regulator ArgP [Candidatus Celerinatantimonas neptuna]|nr:MAG: HTH-type transcriptional regulator ArgP [Candidatus Celerinatantimonas neptuna]
MQMDYKLLRALDAVVVSQSFDRAASLLSITQSAVSQRIRQLEQHWGEPLLVRAQPLQLTALGQQLIGHYRRVSQLEQQLQEQLEPDSKKPMPFPLAVNADSLAIWLLDALSKPLRLGDIELHLTVENEAQTWQRMQSGEVLGCITNREKPVSGAVSIPLGVLTYLCVASPAFIKRYFDEERISIQQLRQAPAIAFDQRDDMHFQFIESLFGLKPGEYPCHTVRSSETFVSMTESGYAYCMIARQQVPIQLEQGRLINLFPEHSIRVPLYWHYWLFSGSIMEQLSGMIVQYSQSILDLL